MPGAGLRHHGTSVIDASAAHTKSVIATNLGEGRFPESGDHHDGESSSGEFRPSLPGTDVMIRRRDAMTNGETKELDPEAL
jgi:hypothetical protein